MNSAKINLTDVVDNVGVELSSDDLDSVSGGEINPGTSESYDAGYVVTAVVKQIYDFGRGVWDGLID